MAWSISAPSAKVAFVETILRDAADGRGGDFVVDMAEIEKRSLASPRVIQDLRLIDLTDDNCLRMGIPSDVVGAKDQTLARTWSAAIHTHPDQPDGVYFASRLNGQGCIALYDRALAKLAAVSMPRLLDCGVELAQILDDLDVAIASSAIIGCWDGRSPRPIVGNRNYAKVAPASCLHQPCPSRHWPSAAGSPRSDSTAWSKGSDSVVADRVAADRIKRDFVPAILQAAEAAVVFVDRVVLTVRKR